MNFTSEGAWSFIIELLESGHEFATKRMDTPPGTVAYDTSISLADNLPDLYIKVQIFRGKILGRSFHNTTKVRNSK